MSLQKKQKSFLDFVKNPAVILNELPVTPKIQTLPLRSLNWRVFEQLCCRIVEREPGIEGAPHLYGVPGDNQKGIDIVAKKRVGETLQTWCYQCKNYQYFSPGEFRKAIDELKYEADYYIFFLASEAGAGLRDIEKENDKVELWDLQDISRKLKKHSELVAEFFHEAWIEVFFVNQIEVTQVQEGLPSASYQIIGTVYNQTKGGYPAQGAIVKAIVNEHIYKTTTTEEGKFTIPLDQQTSEVKLIATIQDRESRLSTIQSFTWMDVIGGDINLYLELEWELSGILKWCGTQKPISDAQIFVKLPAGEGRSKRSNVDGSFKVFLPKHGVHDLYFTAPGAIAGSCQIKYSGSHNFVSLFLARSCASIISEITLVQRVCDDLEIDFIPVPAGTFRMGPPSHISEAETQEFYISRYPITCLQYSFYLQHTGTPLPTGWLDKFPPPNKEMHPVTGISWKHAVDFCQWLTDLAGVIYRLPTEAEWEKAAHGLEVRKFPWGDNEENLQDFCNSGESRIHTTTEVDRYPLGRSPFGVWDMIGNIWEWTNSIYTKNNPEFNNYDAPRVARGGSYLDTREQITCFYRESFLPTKCLPQLGFRIVREKGE